MERPDRASSMAKPQGRGSLGPAPAQEWPTGSPPELLGSLAQAAIHPFVHSPIRFSNTYCAWGRGLRGEQNQSPWPHEVFLLKALKDQL